MTIIIKIYELCYKLRYTVHYHSKVWGGNILLNKKSYQRMYLFDNIVKLLKLLLLFKGTVFYLNIL